jgi:hypothetical protein
MTLQVIQTGGGMFVCTWCGERCGTREALQQHFTNSPTCGKNRNVNSPLNTKDNVAPPDPTPTLRVVR